MSISVACESRTTNNEDDHYVFPISVFVSHEYVYIRNVLLNETRTRRITNLITQLMILKAIPITL